MITKINSYNLNFNSKKTSTSPREAKTENKKRHPFIKAGVITTAGAVGFFLTDLFLAKGKISSAFTKSKESFIKVMSDEIDNFVKHDEYATKGRLEAFLSIPGLHAVWNHRLIHKLHEKKIPVLPRFLQNVSRFFTSIEIHPGAQLGKNVFIDHTGAIIGETAKVGDNVIIIGRVVLGSTGKGHEYLRHTIVEDGATLGMNSVMLGRITIGKNAKVGAGAIVTHDVPPNSTVIGNPAKIIALNGQKLKEPVILRK